MNEALCLLFALVISAFWGCRERGRRLRAEREPRIEVLTAESFGLERSEAAAYLE